MQRIRIILSFKFSSKFRPPSISKDKFHVKSKNFSQTPIGTTLHRRPFDIIGSNPKKLPPMTLDLIHFLIQTWETLRIPKCRNTSAQIEGKVFQNPRYLERDESKRTGRQAVSDRQAGS